MNVCILADATSVHIQRIVPGLVQRGIQVDILAHKPVEIDGATVTKFEVPPPSLSYPTRYQGRWRTYLKRLMRKYDAVHVHFLHDWGFTPEIMEQGCFVASPWGSDITPPPGEDPVTSEMRAKRIAMLRCAAAVTAFGPSFAQLIANYAQIDKETIDLLPLGVDTNLFNPDGKRQKRQPNAPLRVGFFKGFRPVYGATYLMRAMPTVLEAHPNTRFHMIGDGPELMRCKELAGCYGVDDRVKWIQRQPHTNIPNFLAGWDISAVPSECESFGAAALESSAMLVPVVASNVGGLPDTVMDQITGLLVPPRSPEQVANALIELLGDDEKREAMGRSGRAFVVDNYEWSGILDKWVETYQRAIDRVFTCV